MKRLAGTLIAALTIDTIGAIAPWSGGPTLPPPSRYVATLTLWFMLGFAGIFGRTAARAAGQFSVLVLAAMALLGPFGKRITDGLTFVSTIFPANATPGPATTTSSSTTSSGSSSGGRGILHTITGALSHVPIPGLP